VQSYFDVRDKTIYVSSNTGKGNRNIRTALTGEAGLEGLVEDRDGGNPNSRETRHWSKLKNTLSKPAAHAENELVDAILEAIKQKRFQIPDRNFRADGQSVALHAERRIKQELDDADRGPMDLELLAGTMRACGHCATDLEFGDERERGPFWLTHAAGALLDGKRIIEENKSKSIGTYVTKTRDGKITVDYNTDSDSDAGAGSEVEGHSPAAVSSPGVDDRDEVDDFLYATVAEVDARRGGAPVGSRSQDVTMADRPATEDRDVEMAD
jgi:hypothetical protein